MMFESMLYLILAVFTLIFLLVVIILCLRAIFGFQFSIPPLRYMATVAVLLIVVALAGFFKISQEGTPGGIGISYKQILA